MRDIVVVDPGDGRAGLYDDALRSEGEVVDLHLRIRSLRRRGRKGGRRRKHRDREPSRDTDISCDRCHDPNGPGSAL